MYLPCQAGLFHHSPQLIHIPFFFVKKVLVRTFSLISVPQLSCSDVL